MTTTGRTNGAGEHFTVAGVEYVWVIGDRGQLKAKRFDREAFEAQVRRIRDIAIGAAFVPVVEPVDVKVVG
jgi:hypothetical protein